MILSQKEIDKGGDKNMAGFSEMSSNYNLDMIMFPSEQMSEFDTYMKKYGDLSEADVYREIVKVRTEVSKEVLQQHVKNLDALSQMDGFVTTTHRQRMHIVKSLLVEEVESSSNNVSRSVETQFLYGSSLLLWFLALLAIWRRPYGWGYY